MSYTQDDLKKDIEELCLRIIELLENGRAEVVVNALLTCLIRSAAQMSDECRIDFSTVTIPKVLEHIESEASAFKEQALESISELTQNIKE